MSVCICQSKVVDNTHASCYYMNCRYCSLLTRGANLQPGTSAYASTAPDALRHWTPAQKALLEKSEKGQKLLKVEAEQQEGWTQKYNALSDGERARMTYEQFDWAMEAVHSRAFRGDFGGEFIHEKIRLYVV